MRILQLERIAAGGGRVALWGWGREGKAAYHALRARLPTLSLTLLCNAEEATDARSLEDAALTIEVDGSPGKAEGRTRDSQLQFDLGCAALTRATYDVVIKSPGISPYRPEALAAAAHGTRFVGSTALWFAEHAGEDGIVPGSVCITGTKGKSTSTALLAHLLRAGGHRTALAGNIGLPLLDVLQPEVAPQFWAIELSSYQTGDVADSGARPEIAVVLNVFPEHLDWHGSEDRYVADKLRLVTEARPRIAILNAADPRLLSLVGAGHARDLPLPPLGRQGWDGGGPDRRAKNIAGMARSYIDRDTEVRWFGREDGWHLRGDDLFRGDERIMDTSALPLPGRHNRGNLCAVLTVIDALGLDAIPLARHAADFAPLPHRLQALGTREGISYVNDSISTTPHATLAALDVYRDQRVAVLVGGHDRGVDWSGFAEAMHEWAPHAIVTMGHGIVGQNGARIHELLAPMAKADGFALRAATDLADALTQARAALDGTGVVLLSPGAPSFGPYHDYTQRGRHFAQLAGFDPEAISAIPGLGIA